MPRKTKYNGKYPKRGAIKTSLTLAEIPPDIKKRIIALLGEFKKPLEIIKSIREEFPAFKESNRLAIPISRIGDMNKKYIYTLREIYAKAIMEVPIAHKKVRLERLENLYDEASDRPSERREILGAAREELEGLRVNLNMYQMNFFGGMSDAEIARREREIIDRVQSLAGGKGPEAEKEGVSVLPAASEAEIVSPV